MAHRPRIGITVDSRVEASGLLYLSGVGYSEAIAAAGGLPLLLPQEPSLVEQYVELCDGFVLSGGDDPRMEPFGQPTHPQATPMHERRQAFEIALIQALEHRPATPTLGICLGMQMMTLLAGGSLHQHLPDVIADGAAAHRKQQHAVRIEARDSLLARLGGVAADRAAVWSNHHQAVSGSGRLRVTATGPGQVIEAVEDPTRLFYLGVQWHPERGDGGPLSRGLLASLVDACRRAT